MSDVQSRSCPTCDLSEPDGIDFLYRSDSFGYLDVLRKYYPDGFFTYQKCIECGTVYVDAVPPAAALDCAYAGRGAQERWFTDVAPPAPGLSSRIVDTIRKQCITEKKILKRVLRSCSARVNLLDVGCGSGTFLKLAQSEFSVVEGVEPNPVTAEYTRHHVNCVVHEMPVGDLSLPSNWYDAITLIQVIEHLSDPQPLLARVKELIAPGGIVYIGCPNGDSVSLALLKERHIHLGMHHLTLFNPKSLRDICARAGLQTVAIRTEILDLSPCDVLSLAVNRSFTHRKHMFLDRAARKIGDYLLGDMFHRCGSYLWGIFRRA